MLEEWLGRAADVECEDRWWQPFREARGRLWATRGLTTFLQWNGTHWRAVSQGVTWWHLLWQQKFSGCCVENRLHRSRKTKQEPTDASGSGCHLSPAEASAGRARPYLRVPWGRVGTGLPALMPWRFFSQQLEYHLKIKPDHVCHRFFSYVSGLPPVLPSSSLLTTSCCCSPRLCHRAFLPDVPSIWNALYLPESSLSSVSAQMSPHRSCLVTLAKRAALHKPLSILSFCPDSLPSTHGHRALITHLLLFIPSRTWAGPSFCLLCKAAPHSQKSPNSYFLLMNE